MSSIVRLSKKLAQANWCGILSRSDRANFDTQILVCHRPIASDGFVMGQLAAGRHEFFD
jgi:hypothetical protein